MLNRRQTIVLAVVLALAGYWLYARYFTFIENRNPSGTNIVALGDSITAGYGVQRGSTYVARLEKTFGVDIVNAGISGDTTSAALLRFESDVLSKDPKVVIIELGGNDLLQRMDQKTTRKHLADMIQRAQNKGAAVVLLGVGGTMGTGGIPSMMKDLSKEYKTACVPNVLKGAFGNPKYMLDRVHPNSEGHRLIAEVVAKELEREIPSVFSR